MPEEKRQNVAETDNGYYYNQEEWLEEFLDNEDAFDNGTEVDTVGFSSKLKHFENHLFKKRLCTSF